MVPKSCPKTLKNHSQNLCESMPDWTPKQPKLGQILAKEVSQNDVRTRPSKRTDPDSPKPWKSSSRADGSIVFTVAPMPGKMSKRLPKAVPRNPKVDQKLKQNRVQQKVSNWYRFLIILVPEEAKMVPKAPQKPPKTCPKGNQSAVENRLDEKIPPAPSQRTVGVFWVARRCFFGYISCLSP